MVTYQQWKSEQENWRRFKARADALGRDIVGGGVEGEEELVRLIEELRGLCNELFPGRTSLFEMIYPGRFRRLWEQSRRDRH